MASPSDLSLDYKPNNNYPTMVQKPIGGDNPEQTQKIKDFLSRLEEERLKIEAFKRELPLCMQLLNNAVEAYRQQLETYQSNQGQRPVLEEFMPIKQMSNGEDKENINNNNNPISEKSNWMVSAQLWNPSSNDHSVKSETNHVKESDNNHTFDSKQRNGGGCGAFLPFTKDKSKVNGSASSNRVIPELALVSMEKESDEKKACVRTEHSNGGIGERKENGEQGKVGGKVTEGPTVAAQAHRKARRCWSPDLHRRFVNALQILGGAQVATPKQIRELMKVDGLTNDEVKSHLQKYRLHTRRPIQAAQPPAAAGPQLVVLGGIWVPPEYATSAAAAAAAAAPAIYGAHPGAPPHYCTSAPLPQDYYPSPAAAAMAATPLHHHHHHHHQLHQLSAVAGYRNHAVSPESEVRSGGERSESIEEEGEERDEEEEDDVAPPATEGTAEVHKSSVAGGEVSLKF